jgi:hypothetical protein
MPIFRVTNSFTIKGRNLFYLGGKIISGVIKPSMRIALPFKTTIYSSGLVESLELINTNEGSEVGLGLAYRDNEQLALWQSLSLEGQELEVHEPGLTLFRPVGLKELELIAALQFSAFPPRLVEQPIFYPVMNFHYAEQIARDWNAKAYPYAGFVTRFEVEANYAKRFEIHTVGNKTHQELWVPAEELDEFNRHIVGYIEVVASYYGEQYIDKIDPLTKLPLSLPIDKL